MKKIRQDHNPAFILRSIYMIILASKSPRRKALLEREHINFIIETVETEELFDSTLTVEDALLNVAYQKGKPVFDKHQKDTVISADTIVYCDNKILGKPRDLTEAKEMLLFLSNKTHQVMTGVVIFKENETIKWVEKTDAIGMFVKKGRYGGTFAHKDIAFEFASAISPVFKLYLIKEFQRLKENENDLQKIEWDAKRFLSKNNYLIQTDAVKNYLVPMCNYRDDLKWLAYAEEGDLLNVALFGFTAKAWRDAHPDLAKSSNVRDYATINELTVLSNLESHNAQMIREGKTKEERFAVLKEIAEYQLRILKEAQQQIALQD